MKNKLLIACIGTGVSILSAAGGPEVPKRIDCEGEYAGHLQGTDARGTNIWWSFTSKIVRTDLSGKVLASCDAPNHQGDLCVKGDTLYVAVNRGRFNTEDKGLSFVYSFDAVTLESKKIWKLDMPYGAGGITWKDDRFYVVGGLPPTQRCNYVHEYDTSFNLVKRHVLNTEYTVLGIQTAAFLDGEFLLGIYGGNGNPRGVLRCSADFSSIRRYNGGGSVGFAKIDSRLYTATTPSVKEGRQTWTGSLHLSEDLLDDSRLFSNPWYVKGVFTDARINAAKVEIGTGKGGVNFGFGNSWRRRMEALAKNGHNAVFIDVADGLVYPSCPELAGEKAWKPVQLEVALKMARESGLEPIPYMDFTSPRNAWLGEKNQPEASAQALELCVNLVKDIGKIFDHPRYYKLETKGLSEETVKALNEAVIRGGYGSCPWSLAPAGAGSAR